MPMGGNPWANAAASYGQDLDQFGQIKMQGMQQAAQAPLSLYDRFMDGYEKARARAMQEKQMEMQQAQLDRQNRLADLQVQRDQENEAYRRTEDTRKRVLGGMKDVTDTSGEMIDRYVPETRDLYRQRFHNAALVQGKSEEEAARFAESMLPALKQSPVNVSVSPDTGVKPSNETDYFNAASGTPESWDFTPGTSSEDTFRGYSVKKQEEQSRLADEARMRLEKKDLEDRLARTQDRQEARALQLQIAEMNNATRMMAFQGMQAQREASQDAKKQNLDFKRQQEYNKDYASLNSAYSGLDKIGNQIDKVLGGNIKGVTGVRGAIPDIPGSEAANTRADLVALTKNIASAALTEMRNASKTGGALGNVSNRDIILLESAMGSLDTNQSEEHLRNQLSWIKNHIEDIKNRTASDFYRKHGGGEGSLTNYPSPAQGPGGKGDAKPQASQPAPMLPGGERGERLAAAARIVKYKNDPAAVQRIKDAFKARTGKDYDAQ